MPKRNKQRARLSITAEIRWSIENMEIEDNVDDEDFEMDVDENINNILLDHIGDIFELCLNQCNFKSLSTLVYMILKHFQLSWRSTEEFMLKIGAMRCMTANKWAEIFTDGDFDLFMKDERGGKRGDSFYDVYPEIEIDAKLFVADACSKKSANFTSTDLPKHINTLYYKLTKTTDNQSELIRSERMCRLDLRRWGYRFDLNTKKPYYKGHDRPDVLAYRERFLEHFLSKKDQYYFISSDTSASWSIPTQDPRILICHDETTFRSGDVASKRWMSDEITSFFSKGRGRSLMISDFLICHPSSPFFHLTDDEWQRAIRKYPSLLQNDGINYISRTATAEINIGGDSYFDNETILSQFRRLFQMLEFKTDNNDHHIDILVDNARTHTACEYNIDKFGKNIGSRCPVEIIEYFDDNNVKQTIDCYFRKGPNKKRSKGLLEIAKELKILSSGKCSLLEFRTLLSQHPAFQPVSNYLTIEYQN